MADAHDKKHGQNAHEESAHTKHAHRHAHHGGGHAEHEEGVPEWVVSFADNALLQMGFFVILFAMNIGVKAKGPSDGEGEKEGPPPGFLDSMIAIREAFNGRTINPETARPDELILYRRQQQRTGEGQADQRGPQGENPNLQAQRPTEYNAPNGTIPFELDSPDLTAAGRAIAADVARNLRGNRWIIEVRGHTDPGEPRRADRQPGEPAFAGIDAAYRLSYQRALNTAVVLVEHGLTWNQLRVVACGAGSPRPAVAGAGVHRRVEIIVTRETVPADPHSRDPMAESDQGR